MKRFAIRVLFLALAAYAGTAYAGWFTRTAPGLWDDANQWYDGNGIACNTVAPTYLPGNLDDANINGKAVTVNIDNVPASGRLGFLSTLGQAGSLAYSMTTRAGGKIMATTILSGSTASFMAVSGSGAGKTLEIDATTVNGGSSAGFYCIIPTHTAGALLIHTTHLTGGASAHTVLNNTSAGGSVSIDGNVGGVYGPLTITGGVSGVAYGILMFFTNAINVYNATISGGTTDTNLAVGGPNAVTLNNCNLVDSATCVAIGGKPPIWKINNNANYWQTRTVVLDGNSSAPLRFSVTQGTGNVKQYIPINSVDGNGSLAAGGGVDPNNYTLADLDLFNTDGNFVYAGVNRVGHYVGVAGWNIRIDVPFGVGGMGSWNDSNLIPANVKTGIRYGASDANVGTLSPTTGGGGVPGSTSPVWFGLVEEWPLLSPAAFLACWLIGVAIRRMRRRHKVGAQWLN
jgi:hypothetical protein